jgi:hypothetical protein
VALVEATVNAAEALTGILRPRCEATVRRYQDGTGDHDRSDAEYRAEPCGRLAKTTVRVGNRDVATCHVHDRMLLRGKGLA